MIGLESKCRSVSPSTALTFINRCWNKRFCPSKLWSSARLDGQKQSFLFSWNSKWPLCDNGLYTDLLYTKLRCKITTQNSLTGCHAMATQTIFNTFPVLRCPFQRIPVLKISNFKGSAVPPSLFLLLHSLFNSLFPIISIKNSQSSQLRARVKPRQFPSDKHTTTSSSTLSTSNLSFRIPNKFNIASMFGWKPFWNSLKTKLCTCSSAIKMAVHATIQMRAPTASF